MAEVRREYARRLDQFMRTSGATILNAPDADIKEASERLTYLQRLSPFLVSPRKKSSRRQESFQKASLCDVSTFRNGVPILAAHRLKRQLSTSTVVRKLFRPKPPNRIEH